VFESSIPSPFHTHFFEKSGNLQELGIIYNFYHAPSAEQQQELLQAIATNQNLKRLELGCLSILNEFWCELIAVLQQHKSLRIVVFRVQTKPKLNQVNTLAILMQRNSFLDVSFDYIMMNFADKLEVEAKIGPIRLQNRISALTRDSNYDRSSLFGAALMHWGNGYFGAMGFLLSPNVDVLCSLLGQPPCDAARSETRAETSHQIDLSPRLKKQKTDLQEEV
jgi:hypothetical protein